MAKATFFFDERRPDNPGGAVLALLILVGFLPVFPLLELPLSFLALKELPNLREQDAGEGFYFM